MMNLELVQRLEAARCLLTKREQTIVTYLDAHFDALPRLSVDQIADATHTSRSTVHRFCEKLGYHGFKAFKQALQQFNQTLHSATGEFNPRALTPKIASDVALAEATSAFELFQKGFLVDMYALQQAAATFQEAQIQRIVEAILRAGTVYCAGYQTAVFPARFLAERLSRLRKKVQLAEGEQRRMVDLLVSMTERDVFVLFEYHQHFDFDVKLLELARKRGVHSVVITDYPTSPAITIADEILIAHRGLPGFKNSLAVPMTVANNLLLAVEFALGPSCDAALQEWEAWQM